MDKSFSHLGSQDAPRDWFINPPMLKMQDAATAGNGTLISLSPVARTTVIALHLFCCL